MWVALRKSRALLFVWPLMWIYWWFWCRTDPWWTVLVGLVIASAYVVWANTWKWPERLIKRIFEGKSNH